MKVKVTRWPELDILESDLKVVDEFYYRTNKGPLLKGLIFPLSEMTSLRELKEEIKAKQEELRKIEAKLYQIKREF